MASSSRRLGLMLVVLLTLAGCSISRDYKTDDGHCVIHERQRAFGIKVGDTEYACHKDTR